MKKLFVVLFILLILLRYCNVGEANLLETVPLQDEVYNWVYDYLDRLYARGYFKDLHTGTKPFIREEIASSLISLREQMEKGEIRPGKVDSWLIQELQHEFAAEINTLTQIKSKENHLKWGFDFQEKSRFEAEKKSTFRESLLPYLSAQIGNHFSLFCRYTLDENLASDPTYTGKVWRGMAGEPVQAYFNIQVPYVRVFLGRGKLNWGQGKSGSLILSQSAFPFNMVFIQGGWKAFQGTFFASVLDPLTTEEGEEKTYIQRYLSGHRVSVKLFSFGELGLSETVIYGGENRGLEPYYLNPLFWFHGAQLNENRDDNTFFSFDMNLRPVKNVLLYAEFLIDDYQIENEDPGDKEPNELAYLGGVNLVGIFGFCDLNCEYTRINNWTYNQKESWNRYLHKNKLIGHSLGPDGNNFRVLVTSWLKPNLTLKIGYQQTRRGEGRVDSEWSQPWLLEEGEYKEKFPTGVVEKTDCIKTALGYNYRNILRCELRGEHTKVSNFANILNSDENFTEFGFSLSYHFLK